MKVIVIGELCTDEFIYGKTVRLCPEAPVPVFNPIKTTQNPGMAGNVVENIKSINPETSITFWHQKELIKKTRIVDEKSNQMIVRIDDGELQPVGKINITEENIKEIKEADLVIVSDYNKGFLGHDDLLKIAKNGKLTLLDSKKILTDEIVKEFTFIKLNESEMSNNLHISDKSNIIVTLGARGAMINNKTFALKNPKETIDVSGAGDTFVAAFGITYLETKDLNASISFANFLSCAVVGKRGVSLPFD